MPEHLARSRSAVPRRVASRSLRNPQPVREDRAGPGTQASEEHRLGTSLVVSAQCGAGAQEYLLGTFERLWPPIAR